MKSNIILKLAIFSAGFAPLVFGQSDVLTYRNDSMRTAQNLSESALTPANVKAATFGKILNLAVDGKVDAQPLFVSALAIPGKGVHDVLYAMTEHDTAYAFDAVTGASLWQVSMFKAGEIASDTRSCGQVTPEIGITSTPVIDRNAGAHGTIYLVAMSKDGGGNYYQRLHALDLATGAEQANSPVDIHATFPGTGDNSSGGTVIFDPKQYKARTALLLAKGIVYITWASHCDIRPYTGWVTGYNQTTLSQTGVFNFTPNGNEAAMWGAGGGMSADTLGNLYFQTGNGTFDTALNGAGFPSKGDFGNAFVKITPASGGALSATDYWTMYNTVQESNIDEDLGSGGMAVLPDLLDSQGNVRHLATGAGKDKSVYVFDRDNMGKFNPSNNSNIYQELPSALSGSQFANPAYFNGYVYYGSVGDVIRAYRITAARLGTTPSSTSATSYGYPGTSPSVSANGTANAVLWAVQNSTPAVLHAYDANDLVTELYNSSQSGARDQFGAGNKFITPTIANGRVFVGTPNSVAVFGLFAPTVTSLSPSSGTPGSSVNVTLTGANFLPGATVTVSGSGVTVSNVAVVSGNQITATLVVGAAASGVFNVAVTTSAGPSATVPFTVSGGGALTLTSITPSSGVQGTSVNVTLTGAGFISQSVVRLSGLGAAVRNVVFVSSTQINATFVLSATTALGQHDVFISNPSGSSSIVPFMVTSGTTSTALSSIAPSSGSQGSTVNVTLAGSNFSSGSSIAISGSGVGATNVVVVSPTQITATLSIAASAAVGARTVTVSGTNGNSNGAAFTVNTASVAPTLSSITPNSGIPGSSASISLAGINFAAGSTVGITGSGVTVSNVAVVSSSQITATLTIAAAAAGTYNISVTAPGGTSNTVPFTVNANTSVPTLTAITPNSGTRGTSVPVTLTGTNFTASTSIRLAGIGAAVRNVVVVSSTRIDVTFVLASTTATGPHNVYVVTAAGSSAILPFNVN